VLADWTARRLTDADIPQCWTNGQGVGLVLGPSGLVDVDLDCDIAVTLAPRFLPTTGMIGGHDGRPRSHWYYRSDATHTTWTAPGSGKPLVELRAGAHQTAVAPSRHPDGHVYRWYDQRGLRKNQPGEPAEVSAADLHRAAARLAAATLVGRCWPKGQRHDAALALAGALRRAGWSLDAARHFVEAVAVGAGDDEASDRIRAVEATYARAEGEPTIGLPRLKTLIGAEVVDRLVEWLDLRPELPTTAFEMPEVQWPAPLAPEAYHGLAGELVRALEPATEADSAALLIQFLIGFGNLIGRGPYATVEADQHGTNEFAVLVGPSAKGRKGTSWGRIRSILGVIDDAWEADHIVSGLGSGEGLIWAVRDPIERMERISGGRGEPPRYEKVVVDDGVSDKRLLVVEPEFANVLKVCERQANTLSATLRMAWDTGTFRQIVKNSPTKATGAHIGIVGHITMDELLRLLTTTEAANGFANRFLWVCTKRSKLLPDGGQPDNAAIARVTERLKDMAERAQRSEYPLRRDARAAGLWREVYPYLTADRPGLWGSITARAEGHVLRLSLIYAALDGSPEVRAEHLTAALAIWQYCEDSARCIWGNSTGDDLADELLRIIQACPEGVTRNELHNFTGRNHPAARRDRALAVLIRYGLVERREVTDTGGRPAERWAARPRRATG
jgi:hypothetical protein